MKQLQKIPPGTVNGYFSSLRNLRKLSKDPIRFLRREARTHGDIVRIFHSKRISLYFFSHPEHVKEILINHHTKLIQGDSYKFIALLLGEGLLTSNDPQHLEQRRAIQPEFHKKRIESYFELMKKETLSFLEKWQDGQTIDIHAQTRALTLKIVMKTLFGIDFHTNFERLGRADAYMNKYIVETSTKPFGLILAKFPFFSNFKFLYCKSIFDSLVNKILKQKISSYIENQSEQKNDLITMLIHIYYLKKDKKSKKKIRDQAMTFFMAGHETTAKALTWCFYLLSKNPNVLKKFKEEIQKVLKNEPLELKHLEQFVYGEKILKEVLRLYPPAWFIGRRVKENFEIANYPMQKTFGIALSPFITHRDPRFFEKPNQFIPERWTVDFEKNLPRCAYFPFGAGPRLCIGESFANMEALCVMILTIQNFNMKLLFPKQVPKLFAGVTLAPRKGIQMSLEK